MSSWLLLVKNNVYKNFETLERFPKVTNLTFSSSFVTDVLCDNLCKKKKEKKKRTEGES